MTVKDLIESGKLKAGHFLVAAMLPAVSAPGEVSPIDRAISRFQDFQPSGSSRTWRYWDGFTPTYSFGDSPVPRILCGSGGDSTILTLIDVVEDTSDSSDQGPAFPSHSELVSTIRSTLSLQIKELAEILRVKRPTVYSWIKNEAEPSATNRDRLKQLYRIALKWRQLCKLPADSLIRSTDADGHSVLELLNDEILDFERIFLRLELLAKERILLKAEANQKRPTIEAISRKLGFDKDEISDQQEYIDSLTGRRSNLD